MSDCGHIFFQIGPNGGKGPESLILRRVELLGVPGFALHYDEGEGGFKVSHIETGARASINGPHSSPELAIDDATWSLSQSAARRKITPAQEMERCVRIVREIRLAAGNPAPTVERSTSPATDDTR